LTEDELEEEIYIIEFETLTFSLLQHWPFCQR